MNECQTLLAFLIVHGLALTLWSTSGIAQQNSGTSTTSDKQSAAQRDGNTISISSWVLGRFI